MSYKLYPPSPDDYVQISSWIPDAHAALRWAGPRLPFPFMASRLPDLLETPDKNESNFCLIDPLQGLCGFGQFWLTESNTIHLGRIIISPQVRGQGWGSVLCRCLIEQAMQKQIVEFFSLRVYRDNLIAQSLYIHLGFQTVHELSTDQVLFMKCASENLNLSRPWA